MTTTTITREAHNVNPAGVPCSECGYLTGHARECADNVRTMSDLACTDSAPAPALTYGERLLVEGEFDRGMRRGLAGPSASLSSAARRAYAEYRKARGYASHAEMLTRPDAQPKLGKGERYALGLMLTPARSLEYIGAGLSRPVNACPRASAGCERACLATSGHGAFTATQRARQVRHGFLLSDPFSAGVLIGLETARAVRKYGRDGVTLRLNVLTDYRWEFIAPRALALLEAMGVRVYDYTAWTPADRAPVHGYALTYSAKESHTLEYLEGLLLDGHNVAVPVRVGKHEPMPQWGALESPRDRYSILFPVIDGDLTDDRTTDPRTDGIGTGYVIALRPKGSAGKADNSGFVREMR